MLSGLGIIELDHTAYAVQDLNRSLFDFLSLGGSVLLRGPIDNPTQGVKEAFVKLKGGSVIELLQPLDGESPVYQASLKGGVVHQCWRVKDLSKAISYAIEKGATLVSEPKPDPAFFGTAVCFLYSKDIGLFELVDNSPYEESRFNVVLSKNLANNLHNDISEKLSSIFMNHIKIDDDLLADATMDNVQAWDSITHLSIVLEIERIFSVSITPEKIQALTSYKAILDFLSNR